MSSSEYGKDLQIDGVTVVYQISNLMGKAIVRLIQVGNIMNLEKALTRVTQDNFITQILKVERPMTPEDKLQFIKERRERNFHNWNFNDYKTAKTLEKKIEQELILTHFTWTWTAYQF
jgi:molybdenum cofactor biosynthesis enzyme MoaA